MEREHFLMRRTRRSLFIGSVTLILAGTLTATLGTPAAAGRSASQAAAAANAGISMRSAHGITVKSVKRVGTRQLSATVVPSALGRAISIQIVLPAGYRQRAKRSYPVLYLYPGTSGHSTDWTTAGQAVRATRRYPLITVSSDIGFNGDGGGWFTNWVDRNTKLGKSQWETYDIHELIPWIDANLDTISARGGRAVAGLSQGGYGSTELAAHHPDLFTMMMSFSGAPEIDRDPIVKAGATVIIDGTMTGLNGVPQDAPFGDPITHDMNWRGHDPAFYVNNLRGMKLWFSTADGSPGKYDDPVTDPSTAVAGGAIESATHISTDTFLGHLRDARIPFVDDDYVHGTHSWPYWARDLRKSLPILMKRFGHPAPRPARIDFKTMYESWSQWRWHVRIQRKAAHEFSRLFGANRRGFTLNGSGVASVTTPPAYDPTVGYMVKIGSAKPKIRSADRSGRLHLRVPLGTSVSTVRVDVQLAPEYQHATATS